MSAEDRARLLKVLKFLARTQPEGSDLHFMATDLLENLEAR